MERMNKEELIKLINSLKIDKNEFWILSSAMLVMRDLFPDAGDLDIAVTQKGLEQLKSNYNLVYEGKGFYEVNDLVECVCDDMNKLKYKPEFVNGYQLQNIYDYYERIKNSDREKDKLRIHIIEEYINTLSKSCNTKNH